MNHEQNARELLDKYLGYRESDIEEIGHPYCSASEYAELAMESLWNDWHYETDPETMGIIDFAALVDLWVAFGRLPTPDDDTAELWAEIYCALEGFLADYLKVLRRV